MTINKTASIDRFHETETKWRFVFNKSNSNKAVGFFFKKLHSDKRDIKESVFRNEELLRFCFKIILKSQFLLIENVGTTTNLILQ